MVHVTANATERLNEVVNMIQGVVAKRTCVAMTRNAYVVCLRPLHAHHIYTNVKMWRINNDGSNEIYTN